MTIHPSQFDLLSNSLEFANQNHRVISQNLANVNTPNYLTRELSFANFLQHVDGNSTSKQVPEFDVETNGALPVRADGNNVNIDDELGKLKRNDLVFQTVSQLMGAKFDLLKMSIRG